MSKFYVYDNWKPAIINDSPIWDKYQFDTFEEALEYAEKWLGDYAPYKHHLELNVPYSYSGYGDVLVIRDVNYNE